MTPASKALLSCAVLCVLSPALSAQIRGSVLIYDPLNGGASSGFNNGDGTFSYNLIPVNTGFTTLPMGDFNGDGKADVIFYNSSSPTPPDYIGLELASGAFSFSSLFWSQGYNFVQAGDLNHDGKTDFILYNSVSGTMYAALSGNTGSCSYDGSNFSYCPVSVPSGGPFTNVVVADFNGDGNADVFLYNSNNGQSSLGVGNGAGGFTFNAVGGLSAGYTQVVTGDLNGDGKADLVLYNPSGLTVSAISTGSGFTITSQT